MSSSGPIKALVVTNMYPSPQRPALGRFVYDQVHALEGLGGVEIEVFAFSGGAIQHYVRAAWEARRRYGQTRFDVVHAHFGLSAWPALAVPADVRAVTLHGTDLAHPLSRAITLAALPHLDLIGVASAELGASVPLWAAKPGVQVLPCGVDLTRFTPIPRPEARAALGLDASRRYLLFPADPQRPEKRYDRAEQLWVGLGGRPDVQVLTLGGVAPEQVPLYVNAADAVIVPSDREGFGLAALEALACDVPVLATPHGIAPEALTGVDGCLCADYTTSGWSHALTQHLASPDPRVNGRGAAMRYSAQSMAERVLESWRGLLVGTRLQVHG